MLLLPDPAVSFASLSTGNRASLDRDGASTATACALWERKSESNCGTGRITRVRCFHIKAAAVRSQPTTTVAIERALHPSFAPEERRDAPAGEVSYSPLARDVEVDDLALVVDHGGFLEVLKKDGKKTKGVKRRRRTVREASFFFFGKAAVLLTFYFIEGTPLSICSLSLSLSTPNTNRSKSLPHCSLFTHQQREPFS